MINNEVSVQYKFSGKNIDCFFDVDFSLIEKIVYPDKGAITTSGITGATTKVRGRRFRTC